MTRARRRLRALPRWLRACALLLIGSGALVMSTARNDRPSAQLDGANQGVNAGAGDRLDISAHNSPTLARNPTRAANLAVADRIDLPRFGCALHVSDDGGRTWAQTPIPVPRGAEPKCYAPDVAFSADGTLYLSFVTLAGRGNVPHAAWIATSSDGGRSLTRPVRVLGPLAFQVRIATDPSQPRRLYLSFVQASEVALFRFTRHNNPIRVMRSDDAGRSWSRATRVNGANRSRVVAPTPQVGRDGDLYVLYVDLRDDRLDYEGAHEGRGGPPYSGAWQLVLARSRDRGASWEESVVEPMLVPTERFIAFIPPFPSLAVDRADGRVYAAFGDGRVGDPDVLVWSRAPGSSSWNGPTRVNDTPRHDGRAQYRPRVSVAPDGRVDVVYYDRRADPRNVRTEVSLQSSYDGGRTFGPRVRLSDRTFDSRIGFGSERGMTDPGSRLASLSTAAGVLALWADTRAGTTDSNKQDLMAATARFSRPPRLPRPINDALRICGVLAALFGLGLLAGEGVARRRAHAGP